MTARDTGDPNPATRQLNATVVQNRLYALGIAYGVEPTAALTYAATCIDGLQHLPQAVYRCTRCGEPATPLQRRPRRNAPFFGDHDHCRAAARAEAVHRANSKRNTLTR